MNRKSTLRDHEVHVTSSVFVERYRNTFSTIDFEDFFDSLIGNRDIMEHCFYTLLIDNLHMDAIAADFFEWRVVGKDGIETSNRYPEEIEIDRFLHQVTLEDLQRYSDVDSLPVPTQHQINHAETQVRHFLGDDLLGLLSEDDSWPLSVYYKALRTILDTIDPTRNPRDTRWYIPLPDGERMYQCDLVTMRANFQGTGCAL